jgi:hypothetical protein
MASYFGRNARDRVTFPGRLATAALRRLPDFLVIGAHGCGTSTLYRMLEQHPAIRMTSRKETHYFDQDPLPSVAWYRAHFPFRARRALRVGDNTPGYLDHGSAPQRAHDLVPDAHLFVVLRDPVARAFSHYHKARRSGRESRSFTDVIAAELDGDAPTDYVRRGEYARHLAPWVERFGRKRLCVVWSRDLFADAAAATRVVTDVLGVAAAPLAPEKRNTGGYRDEIDAASAGRLRRHYAAHDEALTRLLGVEAPWP